MLVLDIRFALVGLVKDQTMTTLATALVITAALTAAVLVALCVASTTTCPPTESKPAVPLAKGVLEWLERGK